MAKNRRDKRKKHKRETAVKLDKAAIRAIVLEKFIQIVRHFHDPAIHKRAAEAYELTDSVQERLGPAIARLIRNTGHVTDRELQILAEVNTISWASSDPLRIIGETGYSYNSYGTGWNKWEVKKGLVAERDDSDDTFTSSAINTALPPSAESEPVDAETSAFDATDEDTDAAKNATMDANNSAVAQLVDGATGAA